MTTPTLVKTQMQLHGTCTAATVPLLDGLA
jgi:hypothetical protein